MCGKFSLLATALGGVPAVDNTTPVIGSSRGDVILTAAIDEDGWFHSEDACYLQDDGSLLNCDRFRQRVNSGSENAYPAEGLRNFVRLLTANYKLPLPMHVVDALPQNPAGKALTFLLKDDQKSQNEPAGLIN